MAALIYKEETYKIIGACIYVHKELGNGFLESDYQEALEKEFTKRKIPCVSQKRLKVVFDGVPLKKYFKVDFLCFDSIIVEIKAVSYLTVEFNKQVVNYLNSSGFQVGLLFNFGEKSLRWKRFVNTQRNQR